MRSRLKSALRLGAIGVLGILAGGPAYAWDGIIRAPIVGVEPSGSGMVVYFQGFPVVCSSGARRGYLPTSIPNYETMVSVVLTAMATKTPAYVYSNSAGGDCYIGVITAGDTPTPP